MGHRSNRFICAAAVGMLSVMASACAPTMAVREGRRTPVDAGGGGSLEATRKALEGSWRLVTLEVVDAKGARHAVKANGQLTYDAFGTMKIRGVIEDPKMKDSIVLDFDGRIVIDTTRKEFRAEDIKSDRPVDQDRIAPISPDKVRRYELTGDSFVVTYVDQAGNPTAITTWKRTA